MTQDKPKPSSGAEGPESIIIPWCPNGESLVSYQIEYVKCSLERLRKLERLYEVSACLFDVEWHRTHSVQQAMKLREERLMLLSELRDKT